MSNDLITQRQPINMPAVNAGAVSIESERAIAEARGQIQLAKMFPRNLTQANAELMEACAIPAMAAAAFYTVPRAGGSVSGPSIRLAEEIARVVGNFEYGHRELSRSDTKSEVEVYAWDKEANNRSIRQITVFHTRDTKEGAKPLRDQKDIDDKVANVASKQLRGRILALMPKWLVEGAIEKCRATLAGKSDEPISVRARRMTQAFAKYGVKTEHIEQYLGKKVDDILVDELIDLQGVFNALREGAKASDYFGAKEEPKTATGSAAEKINAGAAAKRQAKADQKPEPVAEVVAEIVDGDLVLDNSLPSENTDNDETDAELF